MATTKTTTKATATTATGRTITIKATPCVAVASTVYSTKANTLYDAGYKVYRIKDREGGYLLDKVKVICGGFTMYATRNTDNGIDLSHNAVIEKRYQKDNLARVKAIKGATFEATRTYLLNRHNFKSMKFDALLGKVEEKAAI